MWEITASITLRVGPRKELRSTRLMGIGFGWMLRGITGKKGVCFCGGKAASRGELRGLWRAEIDGVAVTFSDRRVFLGQFLKEGQLLN
jgi:hypothetical protein